MSLHPAFILHGRDFRDTSRLLDVFTLDYGRISLVAKGARSARSKLQGVLEPFSPSYFMVWKRRCTNFNRCRITQKFNSFVGKTSDEWLLY